MKKLTTFAITVLLAFTLAACAENGEDVSELQEAFDEVDGAESFTVAMEMDTPMGTFEMTSKIDGNKEYSSGFGPDYYAIIEEDTRYIIEEQDGEWVKEEDPNYVPAEEDLETDNLEAEWFTKDDNIYTLKSEHYEDVFGEGDTSEITVYHVELLDNGLTITLEMETEEQTSTTILSYTDIGETVVELPDYIE